jgi:hypothetical protein
MPQFQRSAATTASLNLSCLKDQVNNSAALRVVLAANHSHKLPDPRLAVDLTYARPRPFTVSLFNDGEMPICKPRNLGLMGDTKHLPVFC